MANPVIVPPLYRHVKKTLSLILAHLTLAPMSADETKNGLPLVFSEDFEKGVARWELT